MASSTLPPRVAEETIPARQRKTAEISAKRAGQPHTLWFLLLVAAISAVPFLPALHYGFVFDDGTVVVDVAAARSAQTAKDYFFTSVWELRNSAIPMNYNYYRPLFESWLRVGTALFGLHAVAWHAAALLMYLAVAVLVFLLLRRHLQDNWAALAGAVVFGLHPAHIESAVWISGVDDPLAALGVLGSLLLWLRKRESEQNGVKSAWFLAASLCCYGAALLCKEAAVVLPALVFAYALMGVLAGVPGSALGSRGRRAGLTFALRESIPFGAVTALYFGVRFAVLHAFRAGSTPWLSRSEVVLTAPSLLLFYLRRLIWPVGVQLFYDFAPVQSPADVRFWVPLVVLVAALVVIGTLAALALRRRPGGNAFAAAAWIVIPLLPVLDIGLFLRDDFVHDRYVYFSSVGLALLVGMAVQQLFKKVQAIPVVRVAALAGFCVLCMFLGAAAAIQAAPWKDNLSLYSYSAARSRNTMARVDLANELSEHGRFEEARPLLVSVIEERPDFWLVNYELGYVSYRLKDFAAAEALFRRAIAINPQEADPYEYLGLIYLRENRAGDARALLSAAIERNPIGQSYHFALGIVLRQEGDWVGAKTEFAQEIKNHPENAAIRAEIAQLEAQR